MVYIQTRQRENCPSKLCTIRRNTGRTGERERSGAGEPRRDDETSGLWCGVVRRAIVLVGSSASTFWVRATCTRSRFGGGCTGQPRRMHIIPSLLRSGPSPVQPSRGKLNGSAREAVGGRVGSKRMRGVVGRTKYDGGRNSKSTWHWNEAAIWCWEGHGALARFWTGRGEDVLSSRSACRAEDDAVSGHLMRRRTWHRVRRQ